VGLVGKAMKQSGKFADLPLTSEYGCSSTRRAFWFFFFPFFLFDNIAFQFILFLGFVLCRMFFSLIFLNQKFGDF
jgi:hypothetical protein